MQSDLKTSEIQRALLEQSLNHNAVMQPLLMAHEQAAIDAEKSRTQTADLANKLAQATYASRVSESESGATTAKATADTALATKQATIESTKSRAQQEKARALQEQLKTI